MITVYIHVRFTAILISINRVEVSVPIDPSHPTQPHAHNYNHKKVQDRWTWTRFCMHGLD